MTAAPPATTPSSRRRSLRLSYAAAAALALAGLWLIGDALYIHAKALVAQVLLDRAFAAEVASGAIVKPWSWADTWPVARIEGSARRTPASPALPSMPLIATPISLSWDAL